MSDHTPDSLSDDLNGLAVLCRDALSGPSHEIRQEAASQLRHLSNFDELEFLRRVISSTTDEFILFVALKALNFITSNEIGPSERSEIQTFLLLRLQEQFGNVPLYIFNSFIAVYSSALYLNWRLMIISAEEEAGTANAVGGQIEAQLRGCLPQEGVLRAMREILNHFSKESSRQSLQSVCHSFASHVLPYFFNFAVTSAQEALHPAGDNASQPDCATLELCLELACSALEFVPPVTAMPLLTVMVTTDDTIHLSNTAQWIAPLRDCVDLCATVALQNRTELASNAHRAQRCLRFITCVAFGDNLSASRSADLRDTKGELFVRVIEVMDQLVDKYLLSMDTDAIQEATWMAVNVMERNSDSMLEALEGHPEFAMKLGRIHTSMSSVISLLSTMDENSETRQNICHFFALVINGIPPPLEGEYDQNGQPATAQASVRKDLVDTAHRAFTEYFEAVIATCHLREGSLELTAQEGVQLHNENWLAPVSRMLLVAESDFTSKVEQQLAEAVSLHRTCMALREGLKVNENDLVLLMSRCVEDLTFNVNAGDLPLVTSHVVLSRIASIVSIIGHTIQIRGPSMLLHDNDDKVWLKAVIDFAHQFLSLDIEEALLTMSLTSDGGGGCGSSPGSKSFHVGILRSLFFFSMCVRETPFSDEEAFVKLVSTLIVFVLKNHSTVTVLALDAIALLSGYLDLENCPQLLTLDDSFLSLVESAGSGKIELLSSSFEPQNDGQRSARKKLMRVLVRLLERRENAGLTQTPFFEGLVGVVLESDAMLLDLRGIAKGVSRGAWVEGLLAAVLEAHPFSDILEDDHPLSSPQLDVEILHTLSKLAHMCYRCGTRRSGQIEYIFARLVFRAMERVLRHYTSGSLVDPSEIGTISSKFPISSLYDLCRCILAICGGEWANVGVMMYYGDPSVEPVLVGTIDAFVSADIEQIMSSSRRREMLFDAITAALHAIHPTVGLVRVLQQLGAWISLVRQLVKCLRHTYLPNIVSCLSMIIVESTVMPDQCAETIGTLCREVTVILSTESLSEEAGETCIALLIGCHAREAEQCELEMEGLLEFATAYHRVRIRCLLAMLRNPPVDIARSYFNVFGTTSKVSTLSAW